MSMLKINNISKINKNKIISQIVNLKYNRPCNF